MKRKTRLFLRTVALTSVVLFCTAFAVWGAAAAYENTRRIGFGEYKKAVEQSDGEWRVFDFVWDPEMEKWQPYNGDDR